MEIKDRKAFIRALGKFRYNPSLMNAVITNDSPAAVVNDIINYETIVDYGDKVERIDSTAVKINEVAYRFFALEDAAKGKEVFIYDNIKLLTLNQFLDF